MQHAKDCDLLELCVVAVSATVLAAVLVPAIGRLSRQAAVFSGQHANASGSPFLPVRLTDLGIMAPGEPEDLSIGRPEVVQFPLRSPIASVRVM